MAARVVCTLALLGPAAGAELIDRIAVVVVGRIVKESDIDREIRITAFLNHEPASGAREANAETRKAAAARLIEQQFIRDDMAAGGYPPAAPAAARELYDRIRRERAASPAAWDRLLKSHSITAADLEKHLRWQLSVLAFIELKFRAGVIVPEAESRKYYEDHLEALKEANAGKPDTFDDLRPQIENTLAEGRVNGLFYAWLEEKRKESKIEYLDETLR